MSSTNQKIIVSVLMTVYNRQEYVEQAVRSILNQSFKDFEFIIVDDGSTDGTLDILSKLADEDERIVLTSHTPNQGISRSANKGLAMARGTYIARIDSDDVSVHSRLQEQVDFLEMQPEVGVVGGFIRYMDSKGRPGALLDQPLTPAALCWKLCFSCAVHHTVSFFRRSVMEQIGGYDESLSVAVDYDLWARAAEVTNMANLPQVLGFLRRHETRVSTLKKATQSANSSMISQRYISNLTKENVSSEVVELLKRRQHTGLEDVEPLIELVKKTLSSAEARYPASAMGKTEAQREAAKLLARLFWRFKTARVGWSALLEAHRMEPFILPWGMWQSISRSTDALIQSRINSDLQINMNTSVES